MRTDRIEIRYGLELTKEDRKRVEGFFAKRYPGAEVTYVSCPELLGGFVARCGDEVWDASVRSKLDKLRQDLM